MDQEEEHGARKAAEEAARKAAEEAARAKGDRGEARVIEVVEAGAAGMGGETVEARAAAARRATAAEAAREAAEAANAAEEAARAEAMKMHVSGGKAHEQRKGDLSEGGVAKPAPPKGTVYPTMEEAGMLGGFLHSKGVRLIVCTTDAPAPANQARVLEGMLQVTACLE